MAPSSPPSPSPTAHLVPASSFRRPSLPILPPVARAPDGAALDHELERRWSAVKERLSHVQAAMHAARPVRTEPRYWVDVYTEVAYLYTHNDALRKRRMYAYVRQFVKDLVADQLNLLQNLPSAPVLLEEYCRTWRATMAFVLFMKRVLHHLHRFWISENANTLKDDPVRPLDKLLMFYWREDLLSHMPTIVEIALKMVDQDRRGDPIDHSVVRGVIDTLVEIGAADVASPDPRTPSDDPPTTLPTLHLYIRVFEDDFLALTRTFYKAEGEKMVAVGNVTQFMKNVLARLDEEAERGKRLLHPDSSPRLRQATEEQLIGNHIEYLQKEASEMIKAGREDDLKLVYTLLNRIENGLAPLRNFFVGYVRAEGNSVVVEHIDKMAGKDDMHSNLGLVRVLIKLYRKHASLVKRCFEGSHVIMMAIDDAFRGFANRALGNISLPNLIAHYVDHVLRLGKDFDRKMWDSAAEPDEEGPSLKRAKLSEDEEGPSVKRAKLSEGTELQQGVPAAGPASGHEQQLEQPAEKSVQSKTGENDDADKDSEESPLARYLTELVRLFMYLDDKDLFFETHRRLFAKRLMSSHDEDLEMSFINKVRVQMGPTYTQRLSGMLKDKLVSNTMRTDFLKYLVQKREDCALRKAEGSTADFNDIAEEDIITPIGNEISAEKSNIENMNTGNVTTDLSVPRELANTSRNTAPPQTNRTTGWSLLLNVSNAQSFKDKTEKKDQEEKSKKINENITKYEDALRIDFNTHVLNVLHWPAVKVANLRLPQVLTACQELFLDFYMRDKETRKLAWIHTLSTVHLLGTFGDKRYTLVVSTFQACVLLLFNERDSVSVADACTMLNLSRDELIHHTKPLLLGRKSKVLRLERRPVGDLGNGGGQDIDNINNARKDRMVVDVVGPVDSEIQQSSGQNAESPNNEQQNNEAGNETSVAPDPEAQRIDTASANSLEGFVNSSEPTAEVVTKETEATVAQPSVKKPAQGDGKNEHCKMQDSDLIHINVEFKSKLHRVMVPASIAKLASTEAAVSKRNVVVDRSTQVDAMLVRIMKAKKEITHAALSAEVIEALAPMFLPDPRLIKSRLERLIDQEYVERDSEDPRLYRYAA